MPEKKTIKYLSPTGISKYRSNIETYYLDYIAPIERVREPQTAPMSIGSSFDAYCKSYIHAALFGKGNDPKYDFTNIFEAQVSSEWRDQAKLHGMYLFDIYEKSGALADLMIELNQAINVPQFEIEIMGAVYNSREARTVEKKGVVLLGKPDVFYINKFGAHVILDWKVNGYYSKYSVSPMAGYVRLRKDKKKTGQHPDCKIMMHNGTLINGALFLENTNIDWATQLSVYAWLLGVETGDDFIAGIDQICCAPNGSEFPDVRIAEHRMRVSKEAQFEIFNLASEIWNRSHSDHFFKDLTKEQSDQRCDILTRQLIFENQKEADLFMAMTQSSPKNWPGKR